MPKRHFAACGPWWLQPAEPLAGARVLEGREVAAKLSPSTVRGGSGGGGSGSLRLPGKSLGPSHAQETWAALHPYSPGPSAFQCASSSSSSAALFPLLSPSLFHPVRSPGLPPLEQPRPKPTPLQRHPAETRRAAAGPAPWPA